MTDDAPAQGEQWGFGRHPRPQGPATLALLNSSFHMGIRGSIGFAITILVAKLLLGAPFSAFEQTLTQFFVLSGDLMANVSSSL